MHVNETKVFDHSFVRSLKEDVGYNTGHFGKVRGGGSPLT